MAGMLRVRRTQGALSGLLLVVLGLWGALIPFVGPYLHYAYTPDRAWHATAGRIWLEVLPGVVALLSGVVMLISRSRVVVLLGAWLAALAGTWFAVGNLAAARWPGLQGAGKPTGTTTRILLEQLGFFIGLGIVIVFVAALAVGRLTVVAARDAIEAVEPLLPAERRREPALASAGAGRGISRIVPVPVFRGRNRSAETARS
jgi:hypothetical protein